MINTAAEVYHEVKRMVNDNPSALYIYMRKNGKTVHVESMAVAFSTNDEKNIERLNEKTKMDGFMFFAESDAGRQWKEENKAILGAALWNHVKGTFSRGWNDIH